MDSKLVKPINKVVFERLYGRSLTDQELFNIRRNLTGFFNVLIKIDQQQKKSNEQSN